MVTINDTFIVDGSVNRVWSTVSDVDRDHEYWGGLSSIRNIRKEGNVIEREIVVGFIGRKSLQRIILNPEKSVHLDIVDGPLTGSRRIELLPIAEDQTRIDVTWDIEFAGIPVFAQGYVKTQLETITREALGKIAEAVILTKRANSRTHIGSANASPG